MDPISKKMNQLEAQESDEAADDKNEEEKFASVIREDDQ